MNESYRHHDRALNGDKDRKRPHHTLWQHLAGACRDCAAGAFPCRLGDKLKKSRTLGLLMIDRSLTDSRLVK